MKKIKICGLTTETEAEYVNEAGIDYAGIVQFFPKSKRNVSTEQAVRIMRRLDTGILPVAVTVSPTAEQLKRIEDAGFSLVQIHGKIEEELLERLKIPVLKAFNVQDLSEYGRFQRNGKVVGYVFDAQVPGSGQTFNWSLLRKLPKDDKLSLVAGGLTPENVAAALIATRADGVDTSSGVENDNGIGKSREKILRFAENVRRAGSQGAEGR